MTQPLGKLERIDLRQIWRSEDRDFTPWLAQEENLGILGDAIGIELELEGVEEYVGSFKADLVCKDLTNSRIVIENQFGTTDHRHLGQILTYASGLKAKTIIWIAEKFTEEHRAALDLLNNITGEDFLFFGLEIELWKIGDSMPAPQFNITSKPNDWSKTASSRIKQQPLTETTAMQLRYWQQLKKYLESSDTKLRPQTPRPQHWQIFSIGRSGFCISALMNTQRKRIGVELSISDSNAKDFFNLLSKDKENIEQEIGELEWKELPQRNSSSIIKYEYVDPTKEGDWPSQHKWLKEALEKFNQAFRQRVRNLNLGDLNPTGENEEDA